MNHYFLLIGFFFLFESPRALSQASQPYSLPSDGHKLFELEDPSVEFSVRFMGQLSGMANGREAKGKLSCSVILNKDWAYPNALVTPFCFEAQTNCIRFDLIQQQLKTEKEPFLSVVKKAYPNMRETALLSLYGCKMALEASLNGSELKFPQAGNYGPPSPGSTPPIVR